jgi:5'-deoxynucleotidase YfbR-like HD superfamily hydrolase
MVSRHEVYISRHLAGAVRRYHTWQMSQPESIAEHCWNVALIFIEIFGLPRAEVLYYILHHDSGELFAGDVPFNVKRMIPGLSEAMHVAEEKGLKMLGVTLPKLTEAELVQIKICDLLEMYEKGCIEQNLGNQYATPIIHDTLEKAQELAGEHCFSEKVNKWLIMKGA